MPTNLVVFALGGGLVAFFLIVGHFIMSSRIRRSFQREPKYAIPWCDYSTRDKIGFSLIVVSGIMIALTIVAFLFCSVYCSR